MGARPAEPPCPAIAAQRGAFGDRDVLQVDGGASPHEQAAAQTSAAAGGAQTVVAAGDGIFDGQALDRDFARNDRDAAALALAVQRETVAEDRQ